MSGRSFFLSGLCERRELARLPPTSCPINLMRPDGASLVLGPFAETKVARLPGPTPGIYSIPLNPSS